MNVLSRLTSLSAAALLLLSTPLQAQQNNFSVSSYLTMVGIAGVVSDYFWPSASINKIVAKPQTDLHIDTVNNYYSGLWSATYSLDQYTQERAHTAYSISATERFDIDIAVTDYQFAVNVLNTPAHRLGMMFDIAAINFHSDIDARSTYYEFAMQHHLSSRFSLRTQLGVNQSDNTQYYDYTISGEYALTNIVSLTLGYVNHELNNDISGKKTFAGARVTF